MPRKATVTGLDLAAVNSGFCKIEAHLTADGQISVEVLDHEPIELKRKDCVGRFELAPKVADLALGSDLVAIEDYAMRVGKSNTTAYQCGEFVGPTKAHLISHGINMLIVPPTSMRSMLGVPTGPAGKKFIMAWVKERFGFVPEYGREKQRSDVADACVHAYIGAIYYFIQSGWIDGSMLTDREHRIFYGVKDHRKSKQFVGLLDRDGIYLEN